ncbi:LITAF domain-containing protein-like [Saccostrea cucullata]|uniref:LITAF domain-containing protein-like n=1 Tax=Saccostrea cuccullata TaxID=36930 RepID=UPI002ED188EA
MATSENIVVESSEEVQPVIGTFGPKPVVAKCPECEETGETDIFYEPGLFTYGLCLLCLFMGFWLGCFLFPFCISSAKDCVHKCSSCGTELGRFRRYENEIKEPYT